MKRLKQILLLHITMVLVHFMYAQSAQNLGIQRYITLEDFEDGVFTPGSFAGEDQEPNQWELNSTITANGSDYSLHLFGNTWKIDTISTQIIDSNEVWQVSAFIPSASEIQGFGISDGVNTLFYSFAGSEEVMLEDWVTVYQGYFELNQWNIYQLPIADDWLAAFNYLPTISTIVFINDQDGSGFGEIYFDNVINISPDLPIAPLVSIEFEKGNTYLDLGKEYMDVQFTAIVTDPDSDEHTYSWNFGDGTTSTLQSPEHNFLICDDHQYTVFLRVTDNTNKMGFASCKVTVDSGQSTLPIKMSFIGDIMLGRKYEYAGGIIPTQGVNTIFLPTKALLADSSDITIANLECPLTDYWQSHPSKPICLKSSPENVSGLVYAGIDIVTLANNHIMDYMELGMQETQNVLQQNNIAFSGAGMNSYEALMSLFYSYRGINLAFLASSDRTGQYNNYQPYLDAGYNKAGFGNLTRYNIAKQIQEGKAISDFVILEWHSGSEYSTAPQKEIFLSEYDEYSTVKFRPNENDIELRHWAIDHGADLVICHHPHIIHGIEVYKNKVIAHSLGNYVFELEYSETMPSMILNTNLDQQGFYDFTIIPIFIDDYIPKRAEGELGNYLLRYIAMRSKELNTAINIDFENSKASVVIDTSNLMLQKTAFHGSLPLFENNNEYFTHPFRLLDSGYIERVTMIKPSNISEFRLGSQIIWFGNMENEGCSLWNLDNGSEQFCDSVVYSGLRSLQHVRDENSPSNLVSNFEKKIMIPSDTAKYSLAGYIKTQNAKNVSIEIQYFNDRNAVTPIGSENIGVLVNGNTDWTYYSKELNVPLSTIFVDIRLNSGIPQTGIAYSWFDNLSLIAWKPWNMYSINEDIDFPNDFCFFQAKSNDYEENLNIEYIESSYSKDTTVYEIEIQFKNKALQTINVFPNPVNLTIENVKINFELKESSPINIEIIDIQGKSIATISKGNCNKGKHEITWDGRNREGKLVENGIYTLSVKGNSINENTRLMVVGH